MAKSNVGRRRMPVEIMQHAVHRVNNVGMSRGKMSIMDGIKNYMLSLGLDKRRLMKGTSSPRLEVVGLLTCSAVTNKKRCRSHTHRQV